MSLLSTSEHCRPTFKSSHSKTPPLGRPRVVRRVASWNPESSHAGRQPVRRVSFAKENDTRSVIRRDEMTQEDFSCIWYSKDDFKAMKRDYIPTLKKMAKDLPLEEDEESRGLEHKTPKGNKERHKNRLASVDAVLREQDRQWERNRGDQGFISEIYIQASAHCLIQATLKAKDDAEYVRKFLVEEESSFHDVIEECGESTLSMGWYVDEPTVLLPK